MRSRNDFLKVFNTMSVIDIIHYTRVHIYIRVNTIEYRLRESDSDMEDVL